MIKKKFFRGDNVVNWISNDKKKENRERTFHPEVRASGTKIWGVINCGGVCSTIK